MCHRRREKDDMRELVRSGYDEHCTRKTRGSVGKGSALKMSGDPAASKSRRQVQQSPAHVQVQRATFNIRRSTMIDNSDDIWTPLQDMAGAQAKREVLTNQFFVPNTDLGSSCSASQNARTGLRPVFELLVVERGVLESMWEENGTCARCMVQLMLSITPLYNCKARR